MGEDAPEMAATEPLFSRRALVRLVVPLIVEQFLAVLVGIADTVMISASGEAAVSGVSLVDTLNTLVIQVLAALTTGGAVVCSQYLGRRDIANARAAAKHLLVLSTGLMLVLGALLLLFRHSVLRIIFGSIADDVMENALTYLVLTVCSFPFLAIYNACAAMFRSMGNSRVSMLASLLMNLINISGNALLIYGLRWGVAGAGTATLVSRAVSALLMLLLVRSRANVLYLDRIFAFKPQREMIRSILRVGVPSGVENGIFHIGKLTVQSLIASLGTASIAANAIINSVSGFVIVPGVAMGLAMVTVVGQCVGAGSYAQAVHYTKRLLLVTHLCMLLTNLPLLLFYRPLVGMFNLSAEAVAIACSILPLLAPCWTARFGRFPLPFQTPCGPQATRAAP